MTLDSTRTVAPRLRTLDIAFAPSSLSSGGCGATRRASLESFPLECHLVVTRSNEAGGHSAAQPARDLGPVRLRLRHLSGRLRADAPPTPIRSPPIEPASNCALFCAHFAPHAVLSPHPLCLASTHRRATDGRKMLNLLDLLIFYRRIRRAALLPYFRRLSNAADAPTPSRLARSAGRRRRAPRHSRAQGVALFPATPRHDQLFPYKFHTQNAIVC